MSEENVHAQRRRQALKWWSELGGGWVTIRMAEQGWRTVKYFGKERTSKSLTGREIETIWKAEVQK